MSKNEYKDITLRTVMEVLEQTAFVFPEPSDMLDGVSFDDHKFIMVSLGFSGDRKGRVNMIMATEFCAELAANLLGEELEETVPEENDFDSAREMLNIISGQLLTRIFGEEALFSLSAPEVEEIVNDRLFQMIDSEDYALCMVDEYPVIAMFTLEEAPSHEHQSTNS